MIHHEAAIARVKSSVLEKVLSHTPKNLKMFFVCSTG